MSRTDLRCDARGGLLCWQYTGDGAVPLWACMFLVLQTNGKLEFRFPGSEDGDEEVEKGDWLVMVENLPDSACLYDDETFRSQFEVRAMPG